MRPLSVFTGCSCCSMSRRDFLAATGCGAACAGVLGAVSAPAPVRAFQAGDKFRVKIVYSLHAEVQDRPDWPNVGFDFRPMMQQTTKALQKGCPGIEFVAATATGPEEAKKIVEADEAAAIDGYIVVQMNCWNRVIQTIVPTGKPVIYADFLYAGSGGFLVYNAGFLRAGAPNYGFVSSQRLEDLVAAARCFDVVRNGGTVAQFAEATAKVRRDRAKKPDDMQCKPDEVDLLSTAECLEKIKGMKILAVETRLARPDEIRRSMRRGRVRQHPVRRGERCLGSRRPGSGAEIAKRWQKAPRNWSKASIMERSLPRPPCTWARKRS
jgi:hypothetical protein